MVSITYSKELIQSGLSITLEIDHILTEKWDINEKENTKKYIRDEV